ncbi:MAG: ABC-F family ATP-binding cassette domain-containing protein [Eubacteriales bacterium]|nr:ABC-F family ATP-binding cassette domain-containing protein [Eubacteriales bacterium]
MILRIKDLHKSYQNREIFSGADCTVMPGDKLAILGQNGSGKSTLLRIIMGLEESSSVNPPYEWGQDVLAEYLPQEITQSRSQESIIDLLPLRRAEQRMKELSQALARAQSPALLQSYNQALAEFESLGAYAALDEIKIHAAALGLAEEKLYAPISTLSGGEMMRAAMAKILCSRADCLVLDEPTNHLDADGIEWLEDFLQKTNKCLIFVSHDRSLIDAVANRTVAIEAGKLISHAGNYSDRLRWNAAREHERQLQLTKAETEYRKEKEVAQTFLSHRNISGYHSRLKKADKLKSQIAELQALKLEEDRQLNFKLARSEDSRRSDRVLMLGQKLSVDYGTGPLFKDFDFVLRAGQRIAILGPNGCGKSSLLKGLAGELKEFSGQLRYGHDLSMASLEQRVSFSNEDRTLLAEVRFRFPEIPEASARALLARFAFYDIEVFKSLRQLSGGERTRLNLLLILLEQPDLLILDEPTNHLDLKSKEVLENALEEFNGALLCVSHDRHFLAKLDFEILAFLGQKIESFKDYQTYRKASRRFREEERQLELQEKSEAQAERATLTSTVKAEEPESESAIRQWSDAELKLWPELKTLPKSVQKAVEQRQYRAKAKIISTEILETVDQLSSSAQELEARFTEAKSEAIYSEYAAILEREKALTELYFKLCESLESLQR